MRIGVLALQGDFIEHEKKLIECGAEVFEIRQKADIEQEFDGLVLPGGESTVMGKLLNELELMEPIRKFILDGMPVMATCAGMILLAEHLHNDETVHIGTMGINVRRNAYGRQLGSFFTTADFADLGEIPMTFIRAPYIESTEKAEILATVNGKAVAARQDNQLALSFHPELDECNKIYEYFLEMIK